MGGMAVSLKTSSKNPKALAAYVSSGKYRDDDQPVAVAAAGKKKTGGKTKVVVSKK